MYGNNPWGSSFDTTAANNPFIESSAVNRFPALDLSQQSYGPPSPYPSQSYSPPPSQFQQSPYGAQQNQPQYTQWNGQPQPQSPTFNQGGFQTYAAAPPQQYQPTGYAPYGQQFGQQAYGGHLQGQYTGYIQSPQPSVSSQQNHQNVISQFDPYSGSGGSNGGSNGGSGNSLSGQGQNPGGTAVTSAQPQRLGPSGQQHPRQFIQSHKVELESWNAAAWKQALNTFDELKRAWERRRIELQKHLLSGQYLTAEDISSVNKMIRDSESNIDSVTASLIQMQEVNSGYKHSLDASSKRRVREALNAGLQGLPEWP